jgi:hypothetical protein
MPKRLPAWDDLEGVEKWADERIAAEHSEIETRSRRWSDYGDRLLNEPFEDRPSDEDVHWPAADRKALHEHCRAEHKAVDAALTGDMGPLRKLLANKRHRAWLQPDTWNLIDEFLGGKRHLSTGRLKLGRGNPKLPRKKRSRFPRADALARCLRSRFREDYPEIPFAQVRARADDMAAKRCGVTVEELRGYRRRPRRGKHRVAA